MIRILAALALAFLASCSTPATPPPAAAADQLPRYRVNNTIDGLLNTREPLKVDISLASLTAQLLDQNNAVIAEMDISPGMPGRETPRGTFRITEKLPLKRSNLYGQYVTKDTREVVVARAWEHKGPKPEGTVYQGIAMPLWLRLTSDGVGMHVGGFSRGQPSSHGCIRCPEGGQAAFYGRCRVGTLVRVHDGPHPAPSSLGQSFTEPGPPST